MVRNIPTPDEIKRLLELKEQGKSKEADLLKEQMVQRRNGIQALSKELQQTEKSLSAAEKKIESLQKMTAGDRRKILDNILDKYGIEPAEELLKLALQVRRREDGTQEFALDSDTRIRIFTELMQYRMPKLKSVEVEGVLEHNFNVTIVRYGEDGTIRRELAPRIGPIDAEVIKE